MVLSRFRDEFKFLKKMEVAKDISIIYKSFSMALTSLKRTKMSLLPNLQEAALSAGDIDYMAGLAWTMQKVHIKQVKQF